MADLTAPRDVTIRTLFALSSNRCAFPTCKTPIVDGASGTVVAEVCHIRARAANGPRFDAEQTPAERHSFENLILMCAVHHKVIDAKENAQEYTVERLLALKTAHEQAAISQEALPSLTDSAIASLLKTIADAGPTSHFDFRGAILKAGGEGGGTGGGGGGGGVIQIFGVTAAGVHKHANVDASGKDATGPGGGGGGAGAVVFSGRPATVEDVHNGLRISTIFTANAADVRDSLLFVSGAGGEWLELSAFPGQVAALLVCIFEVGTIPLETMLAISVVIEEPGGRTVLQHDFDLAIQGVDRPVRRVVTCERLLFDVHAIGVWSFRVCSGTVELASLQLEMRQSASVAANAAGQVPPGTEPGSGIIV